MGFMTTITFLNDGYSEIKDKKNWKQVIENILDAMTNTREKSKTYSIGGFCNPMRSMRSHHADDSRLYLVGQNSIIGIGVDNDIKDLELRKKVLKQAKWFIKLEEENIKKLEEQNKKTT